MNYFFCNVQNVQLICAQDDPGNRMNETSQYVCVLKGKSSDKLVAVPEQQALQMQDTIYCPYVVYSTSCIFPVSVSWLVVCSH